LPQRERLGRQADGRRRAPDRARLYRGTQRLQLHAPRGAEREPGEHGALRVLSAHADLRGRRRRRMHHHGPMAGSRALPRGGAGSARRGGWRRRPRLCALAHLDPRAHDRPRRAATRARGAHLRAPCGPARTRAGRVPPLPGRGGRTVNHTPLDIVFLGLSITSSWGNGHATTYRGLVHALHKRGHRVLFLERDVQWYAAHRDLPDPPYCRTVLYRSLDELRGHFTQAVKHADLVVVGSYVPDGIEVGDWVQRTATGVTAFYDIVTPLTLRQLESGGAP